jgi:hypothetical protein
MEGFVIIAALVIAVITEKVIPTAYHICRVVCIGTVLSGRKFPG